MKPIWLSAALIISQLPFSRLVAQPAEAPLLQKGDRIVLIGNSLFERARLFGEIEATLQTSSDGFSLRNLAWSGDSVFGDARSYFGTPAEGLARLSGHLKEAKPNIILLGYGSEAAMSVSQGWTDDPAHASASANGVEESRKTFLNGYQALINQVRASSGDGLRQIVLVSPPPLENLGKPFPDQTENNRRIAFFRDGIKDLAKKNSLPFIDLFAQMGGDAFDGKAANPALTEDGLHYTEAGHALIARELAKSLGLNVKPLPSNKHSAYHKLKQEVIEKDRLFFHRWRPANETYLFAFRKHEQEQNAKEIPSFDPLIAEQEAKIQEARAAMFADIP
jgi:lysophospholipase L1-like esterase